VKRVLAIRLLWRAAFAAVAGFCPALSAQPAVPLREARAVLNLPPAEASRGLPVVLRGMITYLKPEGRPDLILQDDTAGIFVNDLPDNPPPELRPGAFTELRGVTVQGNFGPAVRYQSFTVLGTRPLPEPARVSFDDLQSARFHSQYVEVAGVVRSVQIDWEGISRPPTWTRGWCSCRLP